MKSYLKRELTEEKYDEYFANGFALNKDTAQKLRSPLIRAFFNTMPKSVTHYNIFLLFLLHLFEVEYFHSELMEFEVVVVLQFDSISFGFLVKLNLDSLKLYQYQMPFLQEFEFEYLFVIKPIILE